MTAKCDRRYSKRGVSEIEEDFNGILPYNLRKKLLVNGSDLTYLSGKQRKVSQTNATKVEEAASVFNTPSSRSSLEFPSHSQDYLRKLYSQGKDKNFNLEFDSEESSEEEEEGISVEELKKTEGWKLFVKNVDTIHA